jgi:hypothetical protein
MVRNADYRDTIISHRSILGMTGFRQGVYMGDGPKNTNDTSWSLNCTKSIYDHLAASGITDNLGCLANPHNAVDGAKGSQQQLTNYRHHCKTVMQEMCYQQKYWIVGNELNLQGYTVQQVLDITREVYNASREVAPDGSVKIQSMPFAKPSDTWARDFILAGVTRYCDYLGANMHGSNVREGHAAQSMWTWMRQANQNNGYPMRPICTTEIGWNFLAYGHPSNRNLEFKALVEWWKWVQCKRYGFSKIAIYAFSESASGEGWDYFDMDGETTGKAKTPYPYCYDAVKSCYKVTSLDNPGFETSQLQTYSVKKLSGLLAHGWIVYFHPDNETPTEWARAQIITNDPANARTGNGYLHLTSGGYNRVRRVVCTLTPGRQYVLTAWAKGNGDTAFLKALGYDTLDGLEEASDQANVTGSYQKLQVTFTPRSYWVVISLESAGKGTVYWDDISLVP